MKLFIVRVGCPAPLDGPIVVISGFVVVAAMPLGDGQIPMSGMRSATLVSAVCCQARPHRPLFFRIQLPNHADLHRTTAVLVHDDQRLLCQLGLLLLRLGRGRFV